MKKYNGERTQNARIKIEYSGKKPRVSFSYPVKWKESRTRGSMFFYILSAWLIIIFPLMIYLTYSSDNLYLYESNTIKDYSMCVAENPIQTIINYSYVRYELCKQKNGWVSISHALIYFFRIMAILFLVPFIIYFPFRKRWNKLTPNVEAFLAKKKYKIFTKEDIKFDKEYFIELPIFKNIVCDFKASKDFNKFLKTFEIREHDFQYKTKKGKKQNEYIWYARWYFRQKPVKGNMEVIFK